MSQGRLVSDFLVIGGGIIGLNIARCLKKMYPDAHVTVLEKEAQCGLHASGRNSGVLHAGFYYTPDSLKAKFTRLGNQQLTAYCEEKQIPMNKCGKLVVAKDENDLVALDELLRRGRANQVELYPVTALEAHEIEPRAVTYQRALFSPTTSSVSPSLVMEAMRQDAQHEGIDIQCGVQFIKKAKDGRQLTTRGAYQAGFIINAGGLYADKIARSFGFSKNYRILPFKGLYLYSNEPRFAVRTHIYPVPDLKNPFLGVHFTVSADGRVKIGPTAIPALWREQYDFTNRFRTSELIDIVTRQLGLLLFSKFDFKKLAFEEIKKYSRAHLVELASALVKNTRLENYTQFGQPGMRAQLLNIKERKLEMDFILEGDHKSIHILNAVSPAFTSSLPFSEYVCDRVNQLLKA